jgi:hypothetical protein
MEPASAKEWTTAIRERTLVSDNNVEANSMLGEGLTTAAPVQRMKFDERAFDRPRHPGRRRAKWLLGIGAALVVAIAVVL